MTAPLLTYAVTTEPSPLQVSASSTDPSPGSLTVVASLLEGECLVTKLSVFLKVDESTDSSVLSTTMPTAEVHVNGEPDWTVAPSGTHGQFIVTPPGGVPAPVGGNGLSITFDGLTVSPTVGNSLVTIDEWAVSTGGEGPPPTPPSPFGPATGTWSKSVGKFPLGVTFDQLRANPATVGFGQATQLSWRDTAPPDDVRYTVAWNERSERSDGSPWGSGPLYESTLFTVTMTMIVGGQSVSTRQTVSVAVNAPTINHVAFSPSSVGPGEPVTLAWQTTNATAVELYRSGTAAPLLTLPAGPNGNTTGSFVPAYGAWYYTVATDEPTTNLVSNQRGPFQVPFLQASIATFEASPASLSGAVNASTLSWSVEDAQSVTLTTVPQGQPPVTEPVTGKSLDVQPVVPTTFTLTATSADGTTTSASCSVAIAPPVFVRSSHPGSFTVDGVDINVQMPFLTRDASKLTVDSATIDTYGAPYSCAMTGGPVSGTPAADGTVTLPLPFGNSVGRFGDARGLFVTVAGEVTGVGSIPIPFNIGVAWLAGSDDAG